VRGPQNLCVSGWGGKSGTWSISNEIDGVSFLSTSLTLWLLMVIFCGAMKVTRRGGRGGGEWR
jgi:hypothetical protein